MFEQHGYSRALNFIPTTSNDSKERKTDPKADLDIERRPSLITRGIVIIKLGQTDRVHLSSGYHSKVNDFLILFSLIYLQ